jgi:hypothetical protein
MLIGKFFQPLAGQNYQPAYNAPAFPPSTAQEKALPRQFTIPKMEGVPHALSTLQLSDLRLFTLLPELWPHR